MAATDMYYDMPSEEAKGFINLVSELVEEVVDVVAKNNPVFSQHKVKMSGSTRENARVGNPYELDFLISYEIDVDKVIEYSEDYLGFVRVVPSDDECSKFKGFLNNEQILVSDKLQFAFFGELYKIFHDQEYIQRDKRLSFGSIGKPSELLSSSWFKPQEISLSNFRKKGNIMKVFDFFYFVNKQGSIKILPWYKSLNFCFYLKGNLVGTPRLTPLL